MVDARGPLQVGDDRQMEMERRRAAHGRASWAVLGSEEPDRMALPPAQLNLGEKSSSVGEAVWTIPVALRESKRIRTGRRWRSMTCSTRWNAAGTR